MLDLFNGQVSLNEILDMDIPTLNGLARAKERLIIKRFKEQKEAEARAEREREKHK